MPDERDDENLLRFRIAERRAELPKAANRGDWPRPANVLWMATRILKRNSQFCWFAGWLGLDCPSFNPYLTVQVLNSVVTLSHFVMRYPAVLTTPRPYLCDFSRSDV